jgi:hypothetical protein
MVGVIGGRCGEPPFPVDEYRGSPARDLAELGACCEFCAFLPEPDYVACSTRKSAFGYGFVTPQME